MPLLRKTPFRRSDPPQDIHSEEHVFVVEATKEAFKDYEDFFKRTILCNSLVWSCALTGKSGLTFEEASEYEEKAKERLGVFQKELKIGFLWVAHQTRRGRLSDLVDDVYKFSQGRYFLGEKIEAVIGNMWCESIVKEVIPPTPEEIEEFNRNNAMDEKAKKKNSFEPHESLFKYKVLETDPDDPANNPIITVEADDVRREKYSFTRDKVLLFLKNATEFGSDGNFQLKKSILGKYSVESLSFSDVFNGPLPVFEESKRLKGVSTVLNRKTKQSSMDQWVKSGSGGAGGGKATPPKKKTPAQIEADMKKMKEENERFKEEMRIRAEDAKRRKTEEKAKEKERKKEEKKLISELLRAASKPREDLMLEDHSELPAPKPVTCRVPNHLFGDFLMLLEFYSGFSEVLETNDSFPNGITFDILESALCTGDSMSSDLTDILSFTLGALFDLQREEEEEVKLNKNSVTAIVEIDKNVLGKREDFANQIRSATATSQWALKTQGTDLRDIHLDKWSITEILRIHLESAGAYYGDKLGFWRFQQRGGYRLLDDPGLHFRLDQPQILEALSKNTVFELSIQDKLRILSVLVDQIISFATVRDEIDERFNVLTETKAELRLHQMGENKRIKQVEEDKKARSKEEKQKKSEETPVSSEMTTRQRESLIVQKEKEEKVRAEKEEFLRSEASNKEKELLSLVSQLQNKAGMICLGRDRAYRRFWVMNTLPGIFVEDDDENVGTCLPEATPFIPNAEPLSEVKALEQAREILNAREKQQHQASSPASSDKENKDATSNNTCPLKSTHSSQHRKSQQKVLGAKNGGSKDADISNSTNTEENGGDSTIKEEDEDSCHPPSGLCFADNDNCPVHSTILHRTKWSFYSTPEELENLISALNPRGIREKDLRHRLLADKNVLQTSLEQFPSSSSGKRLTQSDLKTNSDDSEGSISKLLDITLRDQALDLEEKIFFGTLGSLKVQCRQTWQSAIQAGGYDKQCEALKWNGSKESSRRNSPVNGKEEHEGGEWEDYSKRIRDVSCAILQIGQMVDEKYLKEPLCETEKGKKKRLKEEKKREDDEATGEETSSKETLTPKQLWEVSLMNCTSYAQLFIHLTTLENSIIWSKSIMNTRCRVCRRKSEPENMLLCDGCDRGHHMKCLKPPLKTVPEGDWFCDTCKPKQKIRSPKKTRRVFQTEDEEEEDDESGDEETSSQTDNEEEEEEENGCGGEPMNGGEDEEAESEDEGSGIGEQEDNDENEDDYMSVDEEAEYKEEEEENSPRQRKSKKSKKSAPKRNSPPSQQSPSGGGGNKKRRTISQLLGKRRSAAEASEKIHLSAVEASNNVDQQQQSSRRGSSRAKRVAAAAVEEESSSSDLSKKRSRKSNAPSESPDFIPTILEDLLNSMMKHEDGWPFDRPITKSDAPDYFKIIKKPMDLGTIRSNLNRMKFASNEAVLEDVKLVFDNCFTYNREEAEEYGCGVRLERFFNEEVSKLGLRNLEKPPSKKGRRTL
eukprot:TRINITY_DN3029_c0_g1_i3.p1 TRINITY_DN3029_c0_g1~~TRINITY_DN3029_c0_g1_i3.p1  ORF type:complete len:1517 (+),score=584.82 TRINITY_DN3029_c0_g1_i3:77-4552(+)